MKTKTTLGIGNFVRRLRLTVQHGELSHAPLSLRQVRLSGDRAGRNWLVRLSDFNGVQVSAFRQSAREPPGRMIASKLRRDGPHVFPGSSCDDAGQAGRLSRLDDGVLLPLGGQEQQSLRMFSNDPTRVLGGGGYGGK